MTSDISPSIVESRNVQDCLPELDSKKRILGDRDNVLNLVRRWKEYFLSDDAQSKFDKCLDPTSRDMQIRMKEAYLCLDIDFFKVMGFNASLIKPMSAQGFLPFVMALYKEDKEIMGELRSFMRGMMWNDLAIHSPVPDIHVVSIETKEELSLSDLQVNKDKVMIAICSSFSCPLMKVCVLTDGMNNLLETYKNKVDFVFVYTSEAHPSDGWKLGSQVSCVKQHKTLEDRIQSARLMLDKDEQHFNCLTSDPLDTEKVRVVVDVMSNDFATTFNSAPIRAFAMEHESIIWISPSIMLLMKNPQHILTDRIQSWLDTKFNLETEAL